MNKNRLVDKGSSHKVSMDTKPTQHPPSTNPKPAPKKALIAGATGLVGGELLNQLLDSDYYKQVVALTRRPLSRTHLKLTTEVLDLATLPDVAATSPATFQVDDVFCCLGTTLKTAGSKEAFEAVDYGHVIALAKACEQQGAQRFFLVSAVGANPKSSNFYSCTKGRTEVAVSQLKFAAVYWIRPSLLLGQREEHRRGEAWGQRLAPLLSPLLAGPLRQLRPVSSSDVATHIMALTSNELPGLHITYPSVGQSR